MSLDNRELRKVFVMTVVDKYNSSLDIKDIDAKTMPLLNGGIEERARGCQVAECHGLFANVNGAVSTKRRYDDLFTSLQEHRSQRLHLQLLIGVVKIPRLLQKEDRFSGQDLIDFWKCADVPRDMAVIMPRILSVLATHRPRHQDRDPVGILTLLKQVPVLFPIDVMAEDITQLVTVLSSALAVQEPFHLLQMLGAAAPADNAFPECQLVGHVVEEDR